MQFSFKRAKRAPLFATLALAALLLVPVSANAAMGGANPGVGNLTPNLRSANVTAVDTVSGKTTVQVCWDKSIGSLPTASSIAIGTYRQGGIAGPPRVADSATRVGTSCADVVWSSAGILDPTQYTYVNTAPGAVVSLDQAKPNNADSTALIVPGGLGTHTGTAGHNSSPSLTGCTVDVGASTVNYVFDKNLRGAANDNGGPGGTSTIWTLQTATGVTINGNGTPTTPGAVSFSGNVVKVTFPGGSTNTGARCVVQPGAVSTLSEPAPNPTVQVAAIPGNSGNVDNRPDLNSCTLAADGTYIDFTFDEALFGVGASGLHAVLSNGGTANQTTTNEVRIVNGNTARLFLGNAVAAPNPPSPGSSAGFNEFIVNCAADRSTVIGVALTNLEGFVPAGDNQGAFASGFTTGPEALRATFDNTTGEASVLMDQRFVFGLAGQTRLLDDTGTVIPGPVPVLTSGSGGAAGQKTAVFRFTQAQLAGARSVQLQIAATFSNIPVASPNVDQILSPTPTARVIGKKGHVRWHRAKRVVRVHRTKKFHAKVRVKRLRHH